MARLGYSEEHDSFRRTARAFLDKEHEPNLSKFEKQGGLDRDFWKNAGENRATSTIFSTF